MTDALQRQDHGGALATPSLTGQQMVTALKAYQDLQAALDDAMPDQIMDLEGKKFRKKGYWRAVALAFNLTVEPSDERRELAGTFLDGRQNFGWVVTYKATNAGGRMAFGDGSCFAIEKARRFKCPHPDPKQPGNPRRTEHFPHNTCPDFDPNFSWRVLPGEATEHNVRSHAHTRAFNRAVSNLVGFGEVSAEEVEHGQADEPAKGAHAAGAAPASAAAPAPDGITTVTKVTPVPGETNGRKWTRWDVVFGDGRSASTFSESIGKHAQHAMASNAKVKPELKNDGRGDKLMAFGSLEAPKPETPAEPAHPDEPVNGPEKILTVREAKTANGSRWVIQTDKRQVVAVDEALASQAIEARKMNVGLIPIFDVVPVEKENGTGFFNHLKNWQIVEGIPVTTAPATDAPATDQGAAEGESAEDVPAAPAGKRRPRTAASK